MYKFLSGSFFLSNGLLMSSNSLIFLIFFLSLLPAQSSFPGLESWRHSQTIVFSGGGEMVTGGVSEFRNPGILPRLPDRVRFSLVSYPAGISAKSIIYNGHSRQHYFGLKFQQLDYGSFAGRDENNGITENYSSSDIEFKLTYARKNISEKISWGVSMGLFISNLETVSASSLVFDSGLVLQIPKNIGYLGLSLENFGVVLADYTSRQESLPASLQLSYGFKLPYLPLELGVDLNSPLNNEARIMGLSGIFYLPYGLQFKLGYSSLNNKQRTDFHLLKDSLAALGLGLAFQNEFVNLESGIYFYGPGGAVLALGLALEY